MNVIVNGRTIDLSENETSVADLLECFNVRKRFSVVEHNREILKKDSYENTRLADGDKVEIVHFVGGG
ncbi:sulfur carrier protein ThiS [Halobacillus mangrovi]|uniref:Thiamine biosynthesis protein ThiS n=1 Tax=Halobacillus mangrovi TaxID=402384 RepID=A0A1W5ZZP2_9BACI|nr:sulfur carrier protein ThiS [Halobacillus mangrovi]ARI78724.1 thiamine biosynthesis protein ThiS [Halobacillus mangrovi]